MIKELNDLRKQAGLNINKDKTKILTKTKIIIDGQEIKTVTEIIYTGQLVTFKNSTEKEINRRISIAWKNTGN